MSHKLLFISLTNKCDRSCYYCPVAEWRNNPAFPDALTLDRCEKLIGGLKPTHIEVTGGEPTLVPWLDDLLDFLESKGIVYLVKSNGFKRCRNQITAWHDGLDKPPINFDKMLIIQTDDWAAKEKHCAEHNIPYGIIGFNSYSAHCCSLSGVETLFLCPDGKVKRCHEREFGPGEQAKWLASDCQTCKAVDDFLIFLNEEEKIKWMQ